MSIETITRRVDALKRRNALRDARAAQVREVRHGNFDAVAPDLFSDEWPRPVVANRIDVMARHASAALSPMPNFSCQSITSTSDRAREFADRRTKIANHYLKHSRVQDQMQSGADQYYTYGLIVTSVEPPAPDDPEKFPLILIEDSIGVYPAWDRRGRTIEVAHVFKRSVMELCAEYPEWERRLQVKYSDSFHRLPEDKEVEVVKYVSATRVVVYMPDMGDEPLLDSPNPLGRCTYVCTQKPGLDAEIRGAFDDLIWVQLALHAMQTYTLAAAAEAVQAPLAVPNDVHDVPTGPGAVIHSANPEQIRRVSLDVPQGAFAASAYLAEELNQGAITPEALGGSIDASVVTGKGVQQLMAGYSQQIANAQQSLVGHWEQVVSLCFEMDQKFWPDEDKRIRGRSNETPYDFKYRPSRDIDNDFTVDVQYGGIAGLDPNRGLIFLLQGLGADLFSKDYVRRNLPSGMDPKDEENKIIVEKLRASLMESLSAWVQSLPAMAAQGQDPSAVVTGVLQVLDDVQKGKSLESSMRKVFPEPEPEPAAQMDPAMAAAAGGTPEGFGPDGLPTGLTPGVASRGPGGRPDMAMLFAGMTSGGNPNLQAGVSRMLPAGGGA